MIGPERGFTEKEIKSIKENDFLPYSISSNILRTETATIVSSSIIASKMINK